jgi:hypothetical protein
MRKKRFDDQRINYPVSTFKRLFSVLSQHKKRFVEMEAGRRWKKMTKLQFIGLMMTAQMNKEPALRDIQSLRPSRLTEARWMSWWWMRPAL